MKKLFFVAIFLTSMTIYGQVIKDGNIYTLSELNLGLTEDLKLVVTREDLLSLAVKNIQFTLDKTNDYLVDICVSCFKENEEKPYQNYSYVFKDLKQIKDGNSISFSSDFKPIFFNVDTREAYYLMVELRFTKIADKYVEAFKKIGSEYLNTVSSTLVAGNIVKDILGITGEERNTAEEFKFVVYYYLPLNFKEYYEQANKQIPVVSNEKDMIITLIGDKPIQNNSLVGTLKSFLNAGTKLIYNKSVVDAKDVEKVVGYSTLYFTTNFNKSIPQSLLTSMRKLKDNISDIDMTKNLLSECKTKLEEFKAENPSARRLYANTKLYLDLIEIFNDKNNSDRVNFGTQSSGVISKYSQWILRAGMDAPTYNFTSIFIRDIYDNLIKGSTVLQYNDAKVYFPYSLDNESILFMVNLQQQMHQYTKDYLSTISKPETQIKYFTEPHTK